MGLIKALVSEAKRRWTHCLCGELRWVVVDVRHSDDGGGRVGKAVHWVSLHISGLDDQGVLRHFLKAQH